MRKIFVIFLLFVPVMMFAQGFDESFDKVKTVAWINSKNIKPAGNTYNLSSLKTIATYTENYFDKNSSATWKFDLAQVKITTSGKKVVLTCSSGTCIEYSFSSPTGIETKKLGVLELEATTSVNDLYKAMITLCKRVGL